MIRGLLPRLTSVADVIRSFLLGMQIARLALMAVKLWPRVRLLSIVLALVAIGCAVLAGFSARSVFAALSPASPSGIGAGIAAGLTFLVVIELCAFTAIAFIATVLQLAHDVGRHRLAVLLVLAAILTAAVAGLSMAADPALPDWALLGTTLLLVAIAGWFQRTYRRPARRGFRDFHVDVVDARHFLARVAHGA